MYDSPSPSLPVAAPTAAPDSRARVAAIALFACAAIVLVGLVTKSWFTPERGEGGLGLTGVEVCRGDRCQSAAWGDLPRVPSDLPIIAWMGLLGGVAAAGFAAYAGVMLLAGRADKIPMKVFNVILGLAAFGTTMFAMRVYTEMSKDVSLGWSGLVALGGLLGIGAIAKLRVQPLTSR